MGYDDNTPLTGVTGGGLPAEIWRETMVRVHEGLPPRPLPLRLPDRPSGPVIAGAPNPARGGAERRLGGAVGGAERAERLFGRN